MKSHGEAPLDFISEYQSGDGTLLKSPWEVP